MFMNMARPIDRLSPELQARVFKNYRMIRSMFVSWSAAQEDGGLSSPTWGGWHGGGTELEITELELKLYGHLADHMLHRGLPPKLLEDGE
jgi:hypothetical protein